MVLKVKKSLIPVPHYNLRIVQCTCIDWCKIPLVPYVFVHCAFSSVSFNSLPEKMLISKLVAFVLTKSCQNLKIQMGPQIACLIGCKITLITFLWMLSTMRFRMDPQMYCLRWCVITLVAFVWHCVFSNKSSKCLLDKKQNHTFAIVCFQMGPQIACLIRCIATLVALREGTTYVPFLLFFL